jgi:hypothetical protein
MTAHTTPTPIRAAYERFRHLDKFIEDCGADVLKTCPVARDLWRAIKATIEAEDKCQPR